MVAALRCPGCEARVEGSFELPALLRLAEDDLAFVTEFVRASGSLKEMAKLRGQSYPTIRNRLDEIIARLGADEAGRERTRHEILERLGEGALSVAEAIKKLKEVGA